ncbi:hypothetical protein [Streptosporangium sp. NPDC006930]|uniref:hypothetical protein n=1 Tax=Streptosporangium sp. NPDC006930 TaxID=3154783 RepID=UPI00341ABF00
MTAAEDFYTFCRTVEARSQEHRQAMDIALERGWWAIAGSVLRMELDSMIRVIYLLYNPDVRDRILASCVTGKGFTDDRGRIPDRKMIDVATGDKGWVDAVYRFGNRFVHLTDAHDYAEVDPFQSYEHKDEVIKYLNQYHGGKLSGQPLDDSSTLRDIAAYAPHVLNKITRNLDINIERLRDEVSPLNEGLV